MASVNTTNEDCISLSMTDLDDSAKTSTTDDKSHETECNGTIPHGKYYVLYSYQPNNRNKEQKQISEDIEEENYSLTLLASNLEASGETELRKQLAQKVLAKGILYSGSSNVLCVDFNPDIENSAECTCYYQLLEPSGESKKGTADTRITSRCYIVCFLSPEDNSLDLFRAELDQYCHGISSLLDSELTQLNTKVKEYLESWHKVTMDYLCRCLQKLHEDVQYLIYGALLDANITVEGGSDELKEDIEKFRKCCSLAELLPHLKSRTSSTDALLIDLTPEITAQLMEQDASVINICFKIEKDIVMVTEQYCTKFCSDWTKSLLKADNTNAGQIRQVIETFKVRFIQSVNKLKRLLKQAETDHYALYRAYLYLKNSGNCQVLMRYAKLEDSEETENVVRVLEEFMQELSVSLQ